MQGGQAIKGLAAVVILVLIAAAVVSSVVDQRRGNEFDARYQEVLKTIGERLDTAVQQHDQRDAFYAWLEQNSEKWMAELPRPKGDFRPELYYRLGDLLGRLTKYHADDPLQATSAEFLQAVQQELLDMATCLHEGVGHHEDDVFGALPAHSAARSSTWT